MYTFAYVSRKATNKPYNEDYATHFEHNGATFILIADGQGAKTPDVRPAETACLEIKWAIERERWIDTQELAEILYRAIQHAHRIFKAWRRMDQGESLTSGITIWTGIGDTGDCLIAHVGHSRCGLIEGDAINWFTTDTTPVGTLLSQKQLTHEEWTHHPERAIMTSYLGMPGEEVPIEMMNGRMYSNEVCIISSDGVHVFVKPQEIGFLLAQTGDLQIAAEEVLNLAEERQQYDDRSVCFIVIS